MRDLKAEISPAGRDAEESETPSILQSPRHTTTLLRALPAPDRKHSAPSHDFILTPQGCDWLRAGAGGTGLAGSSSPCRGIGQGYARAAPPGLRRRAGVPPEAAGA